MRKHASSSITKSSLTPYLQIEYPELALCIMDKRCADDACGEFVRKRVEVEAFRNVSGAPAPSREGHSRGMNVLTLVIFDAPGCHLCRRKWQLLSSLNIGLDGRTMWHRQKQNRRCLIRLQ